MGYRQRPRFCIDCGADAHDGAEISWNAHCESCWTKRCVERIRAMAERSGPIYENWARGMAAASDERMREIADRAENT